MSVEEKTGIVAHVESKLRGKRRALLSLGIAKSSYYRWRRSASTKIKRLRPWNSITAAEEGKVLEIARKSPELSSRQLAAWITDHEGFAVSESTVYRLLRREGMVKRQETQPTAAKEYHTKTTRPHQMWATDASYFRVTGCVFRTNSAAVSEQSGHPLGLNRPPSRSNSATP
jgi:transposase